MARRRARTSGRSPSTRKRLPLEQIIHIAAFRSELRAFLHHTERVGRNWDLTPQRYMLLLAIKGAPSGKERLSFTELAKRMRLSRNTVTELCARAEAAGLITRQPSDDDLRVVYLRLTKEGEQRLHGALLENEHYRHELADAFNDLIDSFDAATPGRRR